MFGGQTSARIPAETQKALMNSSRGLEALEKILREMKRQPACVLAAIEASKSIFELCPISVWARSYETGTNLYANSHYRTTIRDYSGLNDLDVWSPETVANFRKTDEKVVISGKGLIVHESGFNPRTKRNEEWWIAKWPQSVETPEGPKTIIWGALLSTVVTGGQGSDHGAHPSNH